MKPKFSRTLVLTSLLGLFWVGCNPRSGESREVQLEQTAESLEAKAQQIRVEVGDAAEKKVVGAKEIRETTGDEKSALVLEKDATTTREAGELRAGQLEQQAEKIRGQKE